MAIRFRLSAVSKAYRDRRRGSRGTIAALRGVDLDIPERQVSALLGSSGAGKSTLARILMGFEKPDSGDVLFQDRPLSAAPRPSFRRCNQLVFQNPWLAVNPCFTVWQIVSEPLRLLGDRNGQAKVGEVLDLLELRQGCLPRLPHELSGGELQRVALARALVLDPEFLVLDEPFSALDDLTAMRILLQLRKILLRPGLGSLLISHNPRHVHALAGRVAVLEGGRLVRSEP